MKFDLSISQKEVIDFSLKSLYKNNSVYIDLETGFGKTLTAVYLLKQMIGTDNRKVLYICPSGLIKQVEPVFKEHYKNLDIEFKPFSFFDDLKFLKTQLDTAKKYDIVIIDEAHKIKNYSKSIMNQSERPLDYFIELYEKTSKLKKNIFPYTLVSIGVFEYIKRIPYSVFMSGSSMPLGAIDIFNFLWFIKHKLITNKHSRQESFFDFVNTYCIKKVSPLGVSYTGFKKSTYDLLIKNISDFYKRWDHKDEKSDHLRIPEPEHIKIIVPDSKNEFQEEKRIIEILQKNYNVTPENFLEILKMTPQFNQLMVMRRAVGLAKVNYIFKNRKKFGEKVLFFFKFKESAQAFFNKMQKKHENVFLVNGELNHKKTLDIIQHANRLEKSFLIATMGKAGTGFDINNFPVSVFGELDLDQLQVIQAIGRILRKGIKFKPKLFYFLMDTGIDEMILKNLQSKNFKKLG